ncbi:MAG: hypothetical protein J5738_00140 [Lachnospiraceae bacterium]|nr:hypothetical protein [Lachnospiraceae bacterium]
MAKVVKLEKRSEKLLKILMFLLLAVLILSVAVVFFKKKYRIDPKTDVSVTIIGMSNRYTEEQIRDCVLNKWYHDYWILTKWYYKYKSVPTLPYLEKITVNVTKEGKIEIRAYEKMPIGCIKEMNYFLYFDSDGVIVSSKTENVEKLPVITGLTYSKVTMYQTFETEKSNLARVVMNIVRQLQKSEITASEIHFGEDDEVILWCDGNRFDLGTRDAYDVQITMIRGILDRIEGSELKYEFHMENVENITDNVNATRIERQSVE